MLVLHEQRLRGGERDVRGGRLRGVRELLGDLDFAEELVVCGRLLALGVVGGAAGELLLQVFGPEDGELDEEQLAGDGARLSVVEDAPCRSSLP